MSKDMTNTVGFAASHVRVLDAPSEAGPIYHIYPSTASHHPGCGTPIQKLRLCQGSRKDCLIPRDSYMTGWPHAHPHLVFLVCFNAKAYLWPAYLDIQYSCVLFVFIWPATNHVLAAAAIQRRFVICYSMYEVPKRSVRPAPNHHGPLQSHSTANALQRMETNNLSYPLAAQDRVSFMPGQ